jgi:hypothetical protein
LVSCHRDAAATTSRRSRPLDQHDPGSGMPPVGQGCPDTRRPQPRQIGKQTFELRENPPVRSRIGDQTPSNSRPRFWSARSPSCVPRSKARLADVTGTRLHAALIARLRSDVPVGYELDEVGPRKPRHDLPTSRNPAKVVGMFRQTIKIDEVRASRAPGSWLPRRVRSRTEQSGVPPTSRGAAGSGARQLARGYVAAGEGAGVAGGGDGGIVG